MADTNWIKVNRSVANHWLWTDERFSKGQAWIDMLLSANYMDKKILFDGKLITIKRGSFITSLRKLSERWMWHRNTVKNFLDLLSDDQMITYECTTKCTIINICNYNVFQPGGSSDCTTEYTAECTTECAADYTTDCTTECTQHKKVKKDKEIKERKEIKNKDYVPDPLLNIAILGFIDYRKKIKKPMTDRSIELLIKKLDGMTNDTDEKIAILDQSILNGWQGVFELKEKKAAPKETGSRLDWIDDI